MDEPIPKPSLVIHCPSLAPYTAPISALKTQKDLRPRDRLIASGLVFNADNKILLIQRAPHDFCPYFWEPPGGSVDDEDASVIAAAAREVYEESGLRVTGIRRIIGSRADNSHEGVRFPDSKPEVDILWAKFTFEVEVDDTEDVVLDPEEHMDFVWAGEEDVRRGEVGGLKLEFVAGEQKNVILEGFRVRREAAFLSN